MSVAFWISLSVASGTRIKGIAGAPLHAQIILATSPLFPAPKKMHTPPNSASKIFRPATCQVTRHSYMNGALPGKSRSRTSGADRGNRQTDQKVVWLGVITGFQDFRTLAVTIWVS